VRCGAKINPKKAAHQTPFEKRRKNEKEEGLYEGRKDYMKEVRTTWRAI
jgi:hypothetical protein